MLSRIRSAIRRQPQRRPCAARKLATIEDLEDRKLLVGDLIIESVNFTTVAPGADQTSIDTSRQFTIANIGDTEIVANNVVVQAFISTDQIFGNADDLPAGGSTVNINLPANGTQSGNNGGTITLANFQSHPFLLVQIDSGLQVAEGDENNNVFVIALPGLPMFVTSAGQKAGKPNKAIVVDPQITFTDSDTQTFLGSTLKVAVENDADANNTLSIKRLKVIDGVIHRKRDQLLVGRIVVATIAGGVNATPLTINFTREVTAQGVQIIASLVTLKGKRGVPGIRNVQFSLKDADNVTGLIATKQVNIA